MPDFEDSIVFFCFISLKMPDSEDLNVFFCFISLKMPDSEDLNVNFWCYIIMSFNTPDAVW